jgi:hypothetical protein
MVSMIDERMFRRLRADQEPTSTRTSWRQGPVCGRSSKGFCFLIAGDGIALKGLSVNRARRSHSFAPSAPFLPVSALHLAPIRADHPRRIGAGQPLRHVAL